MIKKVLWFSRHEMTTEQKQGVWKDESELEITQINKTIQHAIELKDLIDQSDMVCIVAPPELQVEFKQLTGNKPLLFAKSERIIVKSEDGTESKVVFKHAGWKNIEIAQFITSDWKGGL